VVLQQDHLTMFYPRCCDEIIQYIPLQYGKCYGEHDDLNKTV